MAPSTKAKKSVIDSITTFHSTLKVKVSDLRNIQEEHGDMCCTFIDDVVHEYDNCGEAKECSQCKAMNDNDARFCKRCAYPQAGYEFISIPKIYWSDVENTAKNSFENVVIKKLVPLTTGRAFFIMTYVDPDYEHVTKVVGAAIVDGKYEECDVTFTSKANKRVRYNVELLALRDKMTEKNKTLVMQVRDFFNVSKVKQVVHVGTDIFQASTPFLEDPTWWNGLKSSFSISKVLIEQFEVWGDDFFSGDEWSAPYSRDFNSTIIKVVSRYPYENIRTNDDATIIRMIDADGIKMGYTMNTRLNVPGTIYVDTAKLKEAQALIKKILWESLKDSNLVMRQNKRVGTSEDDSRVVFESDDAFHPLASERATTYAAYLKRCIDADVPRSVMLYGPPGTGKSTMARTIVENLGMRSFRIRVEDVANLESSTLFEAITIFEPDSIILDDFDRAHAQAQLLETLEFFQRHVKLVIATVNNRNSLDEAILRPGRFDEMLFVKTMDGDVVRSILGTYADEAYELVKNWPIAFIQEYVKRRRFMSAAEASESTIELSKRVARLEKYEDDPAPEVTSLDGYYKKTDPPDSGPITEDLEGDEGDENEEGGSPEDSTPFCPPLETLAITLRS